VLLVLLVAVGSAAAGGENVLVILLDDIGVDPLAVYGEGSNYAVTPTMDQLAAEGILFRNLWSAPSCTPTRATLLTGRLGFRTGVLTVGPDMLLPGDELTLPEVLKDATLNPGLGYADAAIGKWHLGDGPNGPNDHGFTHYAGRYAPGPSYFNWLRTVNGQSAPCFEGSAVCPDVSYITTVAVNDALDWIDDQSGPWFLYLALDAPHSPFHVPPHELVSPQTLAQLPQVAGSTAPPGTECMGPSRFICYRAMIEAADTEIGRLLDQLSEPTHVILLGDNGTPRQTTEAPFNPDHAKGTVYEGGVNVPMIVRTATGQSPNSESTALVHTADLFATVLELVGANGPTDRSLDSRSLVPLFADPSLAWNETVYSEHEDAQTMREERFKLIRRPAYDELYDLEGDPPPVVGDAFETTDLLQGACSGSGSACHADGDCPTPQFCDVAPLDPETQEALDLLVFRIERLLSPAAGLVPPTLRIGAGPAGDLALSWDPSCHNGDFDYAIYEGTLGNFTSHVPLTCSTGGQTTADLTPESGHTYYLVVPLNEMFEGSYGIAADGPRPPASTPCLSQLTASCDP